VKQVVREWNQRRQNIITRANENIESVKSAKTYDPILDQHWIDTYNQVIKNERERML